MRVSNSSLTTILLLLIATFATTTFAQDEEAESKVPPPPSASDSSISNSTSDDGMMGSKMESLEESSEEEEEEATSMEAKDDSSDDETMPPPPPGNMAMNSTSAEESSDDDDRSGGTKLDLDRDPSEDDELTKGLNEATGSLSGVSSGGKPKPKPSNKPDPDRCDDDSRGPLACLNRKHCFECVCRCDTGVRSSDPDERYGHVVAAIADGVLGDAGEAFCAQNNRVKTLLDDGKVECVHAVAGKDGEFIDCQQKWGRCQG